MVECKNYSVCGGKYSQILDQAKMKDRFSEWVAQQDEIDFRY